MMLVAKLNCVAFVTSNKIDVPGGLSPDRPGIGKERKVLSIICTNYWILCVNGIWISHDLWVGYVK